MHKSKRNPLTAVICAVIIFSVIAIMPIYCNRENETEYLEKQYAAAREMLNARDEAAAGDLVDTDNIAEKEGYIDPSDDNAENGGEAQFVPDRSKMLVSYPKTTPRPSRSMIHSDSDNVLETHGNFEGMEKHLDSLSEMLTGFNGDISVIAYSLDGKRSLTFNSDHRYISQCTIKISYVYAICQYMDANAFDDSTVIVYNSSNAVPGSGTVQNNPFGTGFTVKDRINRCLTISDNSAYSMLLGYFGNEIRNKYMEMIGAESLMTTGLWGTSVSPEDYVILWDEIYNYLRSGSHYAQIMKAACTNTPFAYAKPLSGSSYSHKSGDSHDWKDCHDVCLVWEDVPYIVAIFTHANYSEGSHPTIENAAWLIHERLF